MSSPTPRLIDASAFAERREHRSLKRRRRRILAFELLDDRCLPAIFAGAGLPVAVPDGYADLLAPAAQASSSQTNPSELVVVDPSVSDWRSLVQGLTNEPGRSFQVLVIDPTRDGVEQVTDALSHLQSVSAVHILSHGSDGAIHLGASLLSAESAEQWHSDFAGWSGHLTADADVLFYACDVAGSPAGANLLRSIAEWTDADVAGSDDLTGAATLGGNWTLEFATGNVESQAPLSLETQQAWGGTLAAITVTTTSDVVNGDTSSISKLLASNGGDGISLREAILAANMTNGADTIILSPGVYLLSSALPKVDESVAIVGSDARTTFIDGAGSYQIFDVAKNATLTISGMTLQNGHANNGGAVFVEKDATLNATDVRFTGNVGQNAGGAVHVHGNVVFNRVLFDGNTAPEGGAAGFHDKDATGSFTNVTFSGNTATNGEGGAIYSEATSISILNSTIADNSGNTVGGIYITKNNATATLTNSILRNVGLNAKADHPHAFISSDFNIDSDGSAGLIGANDRVGDPKLAALANNGGQTNTYALLAGSPAINPASLVGAPSVDQRNTARDATPDIGAFEANSAQPIGAISDADAAANQIVENAGNGATVGITATASDPNLSDTVAYSLTNNAGGRFAIDANTGVVTVANGSLIDYETATAYVVTARATSSDGSFSAQSFTINVLPANDNTPVITSNGGGSNASITVLENTNSVTTVTATDADMPRQTLTYSISGIDAALFAINSTTGALSFIAPPDFEAPADSNGDNVYFVIVQASDGAGGIATQTLSVTVGDVSESTSNGADLIVSAPSGPTTEGGRTATFQISLARSPVLLPVTVSFSSSNPGEGVVLTGTLTFDVSNWYIPQTVVVQGVDDFVADGSQTFDVQFTMSSLDLGFLLASAPNLSITNLDDDQAGVVASPISGSTTEAGGAATFSIVLSSQPLSNVVIPIVSSNPQEGTTSVSQVTFTPGNWNLAQTVTVAGVDDAVADGTRSYSIQLGAAVSGDPAYQGLDPADVLATNIDNDAASLIVSAISGTTTEKGTTATFTVRLGSQPTSTVTVDLVSNRPGEAAVVTGQLTFTAGNWNVPQTVTIQGVDDAIVDGGQTFLIAATTNSADASYQGLAANVTGVNRDDDGVLISVTPLGNSTTEGGGSVQLSIVLGSQPTANVRVPIASLNLGEGQTDISELIFTPANWNVPQIVTITGQDDPYADGNITYAVSTGPAISADPIYSNASAPNVSLVNVDNDVAGVFIGPVSGALTEGGGTATFTIALDSQPLADVVVTIISDDPDEAEPVLGEVTFTPANWSVGRIVTLRGVDDTLGDGDQPARIRFLVRSLDPVYDGRQVAPLSLTNADDDAPQLTAVPPPPAPSTGSVATPEVIEAVAPSNPATASGPRASTPTSTNPANLGGTGGAGGAEAPKPPKEEAVNETPAPAAPPAPPPTTSAAPAAPATPPPAVPALPPPAAAVAGAPPAAIIVSQLHEQVSAQGALLDEYLDPVVSLQTGAHPVVTALLATTTVVSASYFLIAGRVFSWMLTVFAARPMWTRFDPLQILFAWEEEQKRRNAQDESLRSLVENA